MTDLELQVEEEMKNMQFSQEFVDAVVKKAREVVENNRQNSQSVKQAIINQKTALEEKRNKLEDALLDGTIDRETFKRKHGELQDRILNLDTQMQETENKSKVDINLIEEVLAFTRDIYQTYKVAPSFLKRHYLRFFYEKILVKNKQIYQTIPTPIFLSLKENHQVIIRASQLPRVDSNHEPSP